PAGGKERKQLRGLAMCPNAQRERGLEDAQEARQPAGSKGAVAAVGAAVGVVGDDAVVVLAVCREPAEPQGDRPPASAFASLLAAGVRAVSLGAPVLEVIRGGGAPRIDEAVQRRATRRHRVSPPGPGERAPPAVVKVR